MATYHDFLLELNQYPGTDQINEASNIAQTAAAEYLLSLDPHASLTVEEGDCYVISDILNDDRKCDIQVIFDEKFSEEITKMGFE